MLNIFGSKENSIIALSSAGLLIAISELLKGTQWEFMFLAVGIMVPCYISMLNRLKNPRPKEDNFTSGFGLMGIGIGLFVIGTALEILVRI